MQFFEMNRTMVKYERLMKTFSEQYPLKFDFAQTFIENLTKNINPLAY